MNKRMFLYSFVLVGVLALAGISCLQKPENVLLNNIVDQETEDAEFDLFDESISEECRELKGELARIESEATKEQALVDAAKKECDEIEAGYNKALNEGADTATLNGIVSLHVSCLNRVESPAFGKSLENYKAERDAIKMDLVQAACQ